MSFTMFNSHTHLTLNTNYFAQAKILSEVWNITTSLSLMGDRNCLIAAIISTTMKTSGADFLQTTNYTSRFLQSFSVFCVLSIH